VTGTDFHHPPVVVGARVSQHRLGPRFFEHLLETANIQAAIRTVLAGVTSRELLVRLGNTDQLNVGAME
jgi:hypothetical protein